MQVYLLQGHESVIAVLAANESDAFEMMVEAEKERINLLYMGKPPEDLYNNPIRFKKPEDLKVISTDAPSVICCDQKC
ncbi:hypothetical protein ACFL2U_02805 [Patescibacteria group bacterium]